MRPFAEASTTWILEDYFDPKFVPAKKKRKILTQSITSKRMEQRQWIQAQGDQSTSYHEECIPLAAGEVETHNRDNVDVESVDTHLALPSSKQQLYSALRYSYVLPIVPILARAGIKNISTIGMHWSHNFIWHPCCGCDI